MDATSFQRNRWSQRAISVFLTVLIGGFGAAIGRADFQPPEIIIDEANSTRTVQVDVQWFDPELNLLTDEAEEEFPNQGPWQTLLFALGDGVSATGSQFSDVAKFSISGEAEVTASNVGGGGSADADSRIGITFSVPVEAPFAFSITFDFAEGPGVNSTNYQGGYVISGLAPFDDCLGAVTVNTNDENTWTFSCIGTAPAATEIMFWVSVGTLLAGTAGETHATVEFNLDFGDRDNDGLLDVWEEEGISVAGGGFIDLPGMGADPDRKDIFVELDVMEGVLYDAVAIDRVVEAFANAPATLVNNYDGSQGIQLHVIVDGDRPEFQAFSYKPAFPPEFHAIKSAYFGSEDDRAHPNWLEIWDARLHVFRYALWASTVEEPGQCGGRVFGVAEGIPSNDFMVAAATIFDFSFHPRVVWTADDLTNAYAGTFMHELGHTLGLRHGGGSENSPNFKPNYLSVMNYAYSAPLPVQISEGTHARDAFVLDFSHQALSSLDESLLVESDGLDGPPGRKILFNSAPNDLPKARITLGWASGSAVNWNHDFDQNSQPVIDTEPLISSIDINRFAFNRSAMCGGEEIPSSLGLLRSYSDWDRLQLGLTGVTQVPDSALLPGAAPSESGLDMDTLLSILEADWVDQTVTGEGDLIFSDGFESGGE